MGNDFELSGLPLAVARTASFLAEHGVWFRLGRNPQVRSCRDAAHKRHRLGEVGIPLWDELKSLFAVINRGSDREQFVIVHCRGDRQLNIDSVTELLDARPERLEGIELLRLGMDYGLVNPFEPWALDGQILTSPVLQVFDDDILRPIGIPGTMMTNAGDLTWSVELHTAELIAALDHTIVAAVSQHDPREGVRPMWAEKPKTIGILTGNGPESGIMLWQMINDLVRAGLRDEARGDVAMPRVLVQSLPELGLTMELDSRHRDVWPALRTAVVALCRDGARLLALACNTTPHFAPEIRRIAAEYSAEYVSIAEVAGEWIRSRGISSVALVGVKTVADLGPWSPFRGPLDGIEVEVPSDETMSRIHELAYKVKAGGADPSDPSSLNQLRTILGKDVNAHVVLLALTEISLVLAQQRSPQQSDRLLIDTMKLYAAEIAGRYLGFPVELGEYRGAKRRSQKSITERGNSK